MNYRFVKHQNAIGWDWYLELDDCLSWVSQLVKYVIESLEAENAKLRELALGLKWCSENYGCKDVCPLYDKSEPDHCREERLLCELGIEADDG